MSVKDLERKKAFRRLHIPDDTSNGEIFDAGWSAAIASVTRCDKCGQQPGRHNLFCPRDV